MALLTPGLALPTIRPYYSILNLGEPTLALLIMGLPLWSLIPTILD